ncbi:hypothetical protein BGZ98_007271 [Dissophora globulifera]|nr:hypothetical protein BGZ98_007271 [Dissophora globulifera]
MPSFFVRVLKLHRFEPSNIVTSHFVSPRTLAIIRGCEAFYVLGVTISLWSTTPNTLHYLKLFTHLCYSGLLGYLVASMMWGILYCRQPESERAQWLKSGAHWWGYTHWLLYSTVVTFSVVVPLVFWPIIAPRIPFKQSRLDIFQSVSEHALNGVFGGIIELVLNKHFLQPIHSMFVAFVIVVYMCWVFLVHATEGDWAYPFLDWDRGPIVIAFYLGIGAVLFIVYFALFFLHRFRNRKLAHYNLIESGLESGEYGNRPNEKEELDESDPLQTV